MIPSKETVLLSFATSFIANPKLVFDTYDDYDSLIACALEFAQKAAKAYYEKLQEDV